MLKLRRLKLETLETREVPANLDLLGRELHEAPPMPGLEELDPAISSSIERQWAVPVGTTTAEWVVGVSRNASLSSLGLATYDEVPYWRGTYVVRLTEPAEIAAFGERISKVDGIEFFYPMVARQQTPRIIPNDPSFASQWHLNNTGQSGSANNDINAPEVWDLTTSLGDPIRGTGVNIAIVDDGLELAHPDLSPNYDSANSWDFNDNDGNPTPLPGDGHGTSAGGVAAARGFNGIGVSGAAPEATLTGIRLIAAGVTDATEANALKYQYQANDIFSNSWGPADNGTLDGPGPLVRAAFQNATSVGRGGLGTIYTWAAGNGLANNDNVNYDGYANSRYVIAVGAITDGGTQAWYSEPGAPMLVTAYSNGGASGITTTDITGSGGYNSGDYNPGFGGTSSATPLVSGVIALMLQANPNLGWRDVKHILATTAKKNHASDSDWLTNGAGYSVNHKYGFGAIDAPAAVTAALNWTNVPAEISANSGTKTVNTAIPDNSTTGVTSTHTFSLSRDIRAETIEVTLLITSHARDSDLEVVLTSPSGTQSVLARQRNLTSGVDYSNWVFTSVRHLGEEVNGTWTLTVRDLRTGTTGNFGSWSIRAYGIGAPQVATIETAAAQFNETLPAVPVTDTLTINRAFSTTVTSAVVAIATNYEVGADVLTFTNQNGISGSFSNGILTLTGSSSLANYEAAIRSVKFDNPTTTPSGFTRTITFRITDSEGFTSNVGSRLLNFNAAPVAVNDAYSINEDTTLTVPVGTGVRSNDSDPNTATSTLTISQLTAPTHGSFNLAANGSFTYVPDANYNGPDGFTYRVSDGVLTSTGSVSLTVNSINDAPTATGESFSIPEDAPLIVPLSGSLLNNDSDVDVGSTLTAILVANAPPAQGSVTLNANGSFIFTPASNFSGATNFTYKVRDQSNAVSATVAVALQVNPVNDAPQAVNDGTILITGTAKSIAPVVNDTDVDGDSLVLLSFTSPAKGRVTRQGNTLVYTPISGAAGIDTFNYTVRDPLGLTSTAQITVNNVDSIKPKVTSIRAYYGTGNRSFIDLFAPYRSVLPWQNISRIEVGFSEPVSIATNDLTVTGLNGAYAFAGSPTTTNNRVWTWNLAAPLGIDRIRLRLAPTISDLAIIPNAMGTPFLRNFGVLPGDYNGNGIVETVDPTKIQQKYSTNVTTSDRFADINGDGIVNLLDKTIAQTNLGKRLP